MQLEVLTLTFKKIVSYTLAGPGVTPGCIQTQRLSRGAMVEMFCLGVISLHCRGPGKWILWAAAAWRPHTLSRT